MKKPEPQSYLYVGIQLVLLIMYFIPLTDAPFHPGIVVKTASFFMALTGLMLFIFAVLKLDKNLTVLPTPKEKGTLIQTGLYKFIRHPIYTGIILATIGYGIFTGSLWKSVTGVTLWILFYFKSVYEERLLEQQYPDYKTYRKHTGRFFPFI